MSKLQISDLLNTITNQSSNLKNYQKGHQIKDQLNINNKNKANHNNGKNVKASKATQQFLTQGNMKIKKIRKNDQIQMKRQLNYQATQQDMDKWLGIVKLNRQKQTLDLTRKQKDSAKINFFPSKPVSELQAKTDQILNSLNMKNEKQVMKAEQKQLNKLDPQQAKKRVIQARKHRTAVFYQQIKNRRISKIKSKVYHKIKNRQKMRQQKKQISEMNMAQKSQYLQKLTKNRIKQRINLRHNSKNKHIQHLLRFNKYNKQGIQDALNQVNQIRAKQLQKNHLDDQLLKDMSQQYDDQNYRQQAIQDLQKQLKQMEDQADQQYQEKGGINAMKFMKVAKTNKQAKDIRDAYRLINQLGNQQSQDIDINSNQDHQSQSILDQNGQKQLTRKVYGEKNVEDKKPTQSQGKKTFIQKNINQALIPADRIQQLTKGIDVQNLKDKYQPQRIDLKLNQQLIEQNREIFNNNYDNQNQAVLQNLRQFQADKIQDYNQAIQPEKKHAKGWGNWAGPNIKQKKVDPQVQIRKKLAKIQQIKRKRKDGQLSNVIINQVRNKTLKDYMVRTLPHNYTNVDQFEFMNRQELGPQWNSMTQFSANIKPKVLTKVGQVIEPIRMPKKINKNQRN